MSVKLASWRFLKQKILQRQQPEERQNYIAGPISYSGAVAKINTQTNVDESIGRPVLTSKKSMVRTLTHLSRVKRFFNHKRPQQSDIIINVFSLHGYSSLRMNQDGPKACANKVSQHTVCITLYINSQSCKCYFLHIAGRVRLLADSLFSNFDHTGIYGLLPEFQDSIAILQVK